MEKRKISLLFIILTTLCVSNLFAEEQVEEYAEELLIEEAIEDQSEADQTKEDQPKAEKSKFAKAFNNAMEIIFPWPIVSLETGYPEVFSIDLGLETLIIPLSEFGRAGPYFAFGYARSIYDNFFRFSTGFAFGAMGFVDMHGGFGCGIMPKNHEKLYTFFTEFSVRYIIFEVKFMYEKPLEPSNLVDYYKTTYPSEDGYKFKIGLSI